MGNFFSGLAQTAVHAAPFAAQVLAQREAKEEADRQRALAQLHQQNQDSTASMLANSRAGVDLATIGHLGAQTEALRNPQTGVKVITDGDGNVHLVPAKIASDATSVTPISAGKIGTPKTSSDPLVKTVGPDGKPVYTARSQAAGKEAPVAAPPQQSFTPFQGTDPNGNPVVRPFNTKTGQFGAEADVFPKAPAGGAGGSSSLSAEDRAKMLNQAKLDHQTMKDYEDKVLTGKAKVGTAAGIAGASADAHGGVVNNIIGIVGNTATGALDADYQKYLTAQRSYGRIMGNLQSKRYTDHQAEIERSISGLQGNDLAGTIRYKQQLRESSLADPVTAPAPSSPASPAGRGRGGPPPNVPHAANKGDADGNINLGGGSGATPTRAQALWDAAVAKHGRETVLREVGPRPE